jgi:tRNA(Ile)-lysidine synthase
VVACSGGGDSTALLILLTDHARERGLVVVAAHIAHGLRGKAGRLDALATARLCASLSLPFSYRSLDVKELKAKGESLESAGRRLRYEALLSLASELDGALIATGHTRDDQAETVLLNLARRSGRSRGGIRPRREDGVVRPLLPFSRAELRDELTRRGVAWREDETNENEAFERNRIRRKVLPALEAASPGTAERLTRAAAAWTARLDLLDRSLDEALRAAGAPLCGPYPRSVFDTFSREAAGRLLVRAVAGSGRVPGRAQVDRVLSRMQRREHRFVEALAGFRLHVDSRAVRLLSPDTLQP